MTTSRYKGRHSKPPWMSTAAIVLGFGSALACLGLLLGLLFPASVMNPGPASTPTVSTSTQPPSKPAVTPQKHANSVQPHKPAATAARVITVHAGDCLWTLAEHYLGDGSRWPSIYLANRSVIGFDPNLILPGQKLKIWS